MGVTDFEATHATRLIIGRPLVRVQPGPLGTVMAGVMSRDVVGSHAGESGPAPRISGDHRRRCNIRPVMASIHSPAELPGAELIEQGLDDLAPERETEAALLLEIAAPRLRSVGVSVPVHRDGNGQSPDTGSMRC